jgi:hypothetical protein
MTTEVLTQAVGAGGTAIFSRGSHFYLQTATTAVNVVATRQGGASAIEKFTGVTSGFKATLDYVADFWTVTSAAAQSVTVAVGDGDVTFAGAVSLTGTTYAFATTTIAGVSSADISVAAGATSALAGAVNQKRVTVGVPSTQTGSLRIRWGGLGGTSGIEIQPGTFVTLNVNMGTELYNPNAVAVTYYYWNEA